MRLQNKMRWKQQLNHQTAIESFVGFWQLAIAHDRIAKQTQFTQISIVMFNRRKRREGKLTFPAVGDAISNELIYQISFKSIRIELIPCILWYELRCDLSLNKFVKHEKKKGKEFSDMSKFLVHNWKHIERTFIGSGFNVMWRLTAMTAPFDVSNCNPFTQLNEPFSAFQTNQHISNQ